jgi:hypothetical protein
MPIVKSTLDFVDQIELVDAATAVTGTAGVSSDAGFLITAHPDNSGVVYLFENATGKTVDNGYPLEPGLHVVAAVTWLDQIQFESSVAAQKVCWIKL